MPFKVAPVDVMAVAAVVVTVGPIAAPTVTVVGHLLVSLQAIDSSTSPMLKVLVPTVPIVMVPVIMVPVVLAPAASVVVDGGPKPQRQ